MSTEGGNLFDIPESLPNEHVAALLVSPNVRIERVVSRGHASPPDFWYDQNGPEWVMVVAGSAGIAFEGETTPRTLNAGDHVHIPARARHRVAWTDASQPTIWLAVHYR